MVIVARKLSNPLSICVDCGKSYRQDKKLDLIDRIYCNKCNEKFEQDMVDRQDPTKMDICAGKHIRPKTKRDKNTPKKPRKKHDFKHEFVLSY